MKRFISGISAFGALMLIVLIGLGFAQSHHPAFDSFSHFRLIFAAALLLVTPLLWLKGRKPIAWAALATIVITVIVTLPYFPGMQRGFALKNSTKDWNRISVIQLNMRFNNEDTDRIVSTLKKYPSDVLLLQELTKTTAPVLGAFSQAYPYQLECYSSGVGSVAILSKHPLAGTPSKSCLRFDGFASASLAVGDTEFTVASFHSRWPWPAGQSRQLDRLTPEFQNLRRDFSILAGDFNAAPWSHALTQVSNMTGLQIPSGLKFTWAPRLQDTRTISKHFSDTPNELQRLKLPQWVVDFQNLFGPILPIDHILHSSNLSPLSREVLPDVGSDHYPIRTVFVWK
jgi:endonuclease/exonuclease/phosphatase (EEP) superfamily protein YafD